MKKTAPKRAVFKNQCPKSYRVCPLVTKDIPSFKNLECLSVEETNQQVSKAQIGKFNSLKICLF